jgi:hypothetical protein
LIQGIAHGQLVGVGPGRIAESFHVNDQDSAVNGWLKHLTRLTSCNCGLDSGGGDGPPEGRQETLAPFPLGNPYQTLTGTSHQVLAAAELVPAPEHALISQLALDEPRVFQAADVGLLSGG